MPLRIGVTVPLNGIIADLRNAVSDMTGIKEESLILTELYHDGFHRTFHDRQSLSVVHEGDNLYAFEEPSGLFPEMDAAEVQSPVMADGNSGPIQDTIVILVANCQNPGKNTSSKRYALKVNQSFASHKSINFAAAYWCHCAAKINGIQDTIVILVANCQNPGENTSSKRYALIVNQSFASHKSINFAVFKG